MGNASSQVAQTQDTTTRTESTTPGTMGTRASPAPRSSSSYDDADDNLAATQLQQELGSPVRLPSPRLRTNKGLPDGHGSNGSPSLGSSRRAPAPAAAWERKAATMAPASVPPKQSRPCDDAPGPLDVLFPDEHEPSLPKINTLSLTALVPRLAGSASARSSGVVQVPNTQKGSYAAFNELPSPENPRYTVPASSIETDAGGKARRRIITVNMGDSESPQPKSPQPASGNWTSSTQEASNGRAVPRARGARKAVPAASITPILPKDRLKILKAGRSAEIGSGMSPGYHKITQPLLEQTVHERVHAPPRRVGGIAAETRRDSHGRQQLQVQQKVTKISAQTPYASPAAAAAQFASSGKDRRSYIWSSSSSSSSSKRRSRVVPVDPGEEAGPAVGPSAVKPPNLVEELSGATITHQPTTPSPAAVTDHLHTRSAGSATKATTKNTAATAAGAPAASLQTSNPFAREIFASLEEIALGTQALMALDFSTPAMPVPQTKSRKRKSKAEDSHDADFPSGHVPAEEAPAQPKKNKTSSTDAAAEPVEAAPEAAEQLKEKKKKSKKRAGEGAEREVPETQPMEIDESAAAVATDAADEATEPAAAPQEKERRKSTRKSAIAAAAAAEEDAAGDSSLLEAIPSKRRSFGRGRKQTATGADAELAIEHTLLNPPDLREYGEFTADEAELLRRQVKRYQYEWSLSVHDMVNMIQWTKPYAEGGKANGSNQQEAQQFAASTNFWAQIYDTLPKRKNFKTKGGTTAIQRFVRRKYHNFPKGHGGWTDEEDAELAQMYRKYPNSWKKIAEALGDRSESACRDRWRNYVLYGDSRNTAAWSDLELENLAKSIDAVIEADKNDRIKNGRPQLDQYTSRDINWKFVSDKVGTRSRLQCQMKWRGMQNRPYQEKKEKEAKKAPKAKAKAKKETKAKTGPGFEKMLGGDKLDIILALSECAPETEEDIDWKDVKEKEEGSRGGPSPWSKKDRQAVLKELGDAVGEQDDLSTTLNAIALYLQDMYGAEGLEEHYDPAEDPELAEEVQEKGTKRKRASEGAKAQRSSFKKFKSADTISASDEE